MGASNSYEKKTRTISQFIILCSGGLILLLLLLIITVNYNVQKNLIYDRYENQMAEVLRYVKSHIDVDDLEQVWRTRVKTDTYNELQEFMDDFVDNYDVHYLYIGYPEIDGDEIHFYSLCSANSTEDKEKGEDYLIYLGDDAAGAYTRQLIQLLVSAMKQDDIVYFDDYTGWGEDYSACMPLVNSKGEHFAVLCVDERISEIDSATMKNIIFTSLIIAIIGIIFSVIMIYLLNVNLVEPILEIAATLSKSEYRKSGSRVTMIKELESSDSGGREVKKLREALISFLKSVR